MGRFHGKKKYKVNYLPLHCADNALGIHSYIAELATLMKKSKLPTTFHDMRQKWLQFAKNKSHAITSDLQRHTTCMEVSRHVLEYQVRDLKRRLETAEATLEAQVSKQRRLAAKVYDEFPARPHD
ncbi:hypothetical protein H257_15021 [Aphanomyces astaci]|uniref:Uncharacterized protein n=1 Tax=Aphanomyces astaci TaxID=112090 RepID=W4FNY1_APHAT|nr:hypothetical protein H257_15021 [Aphanomyces astaci]ETV69192.1 hypothetical protein H257_15021 [Aphanomyces astaci]|eukprot:XP_009841294.1 hypothetical protein H257_15021 [Aphanomyces astaci]